MLTCTCLLALTLAAGPEPVAQVVTAMPGAGILRADKRVEVTKDLPLPLLLSDTLDVPVGGVLFVQVLANGHVVRVDEDIQLPVKDLAALRLKKQGVARAAKDQVEALLTPKERADLQPRLMGWFVSTTAANVPSVRDEEGGKLEDALVGPATKGPGLQKSLDVSGGSSLGGGGSTQAGGRGVGLGLASNEAVRPPKRTLETKATKEPQEPKDMKPRDVANAPPPKPEPTTGVPRPPPPPSSPTPEPVTPPALQPPDAATRACLVDAARALGGDAFTALGPSLTVRLRRGDDGVKLFLEGGVPVPDCARAWANAQRAALPASGWLPVEVPLR